jgi:hypothetical protein
MAKGQLQVCLPLNETSVRQRTQALLAGETIGLVLPALRHYDVLNPTSVASM